MGGRTAPTAVSPADTQTQASAARARAIVMETERRLGFEPTDRELEKLGYDIESRGCVLEAAQRGAGTRPGACLGLGR